MQAGSNFEKKTVSISDVVNDSAFIAGMKSVRDCAEYDPPITCDLLDNPRTAGDLYDRGRQTEVMCRVMNDDCATRVFMTCYQNGWIL